MAKTSIGAVPIIRAPIYYNENDFFEVRGVGLDVLFMLFKKYTQSIEDMFVEFMERENAGEAVQTEFVRGFAEQALVKTPQLLHELIAIAADEPESVATVAQLRAPIQVEALMQILTLTITTESELKKVIESVTQGMMKYNALAARITRWPALQAFKNGFGASESA